MEKVTGEEGWISLGPWGPEGWSQRSRCGASYKADGPVMEITVHYSQLSPVSDTESIDAISFQSNSRDVVVIGCSEMGSSRCQRKVRIDGSVEKLLSITLTYNTFCITSLTFYTTLNKYGPIGPFDEKDTTFSTPRDGGVIVGFHGCGEVDRNNRLLAIGVFVVPKVESLHSIQDPNSGPSQNKVADLQKIEEEFETKIKELKKEMEDVATENEVLRKRNEEIEKKIKIIVEGGIPSGPWGGGGGSYWEYKTNVSPVMEITLIYGQVINSVLFRNKSHNGDVIGSSNRIGGPGGDHEKKFFINSSIEQLTSISVTYKEHNGEEIITSLCFYSTRHKYGPFGKVCGLPVSIPIEGAVLAGFHGRVGTFLNAIGIFVAPKVLDGEQKLICSVWRKSDRHIISLQRWLP